MLPRTSTTLSGLGEVLLSSQGVNFRLRFSQCANCVLGGALSDFFSHGFHINDKVRGVGVLKYRPLLIKSRELVYTLVEELSPNNQYPAAQSQYLAL